MKFREWTSSFETDANYRIIIQQKENTDDEYRYPDEDPDPLGVNQEGMSELQKTKAAEIAKKLGK